VEQVRSNFDGFWNWKFFFSLFGIVNFVRYDLLFAKIVKRSHSHKRILVSQILFFSTTFLFWESVSTFLCTEAANRVIFLYKNVII
jgi:hypothetical protein